MTIARAAVWLKGPPKTRIAQSATSAGVRKLKHKQTTLGETSDSEKALALGE